VVSYGIAIKQKEFTTYTPPSILHVVLVGAGSLGSNQSSTSDANACMEIAGVVKHLQEAFSRFFRYNIAISLVDSFGKVMIYFFYVVIFFSIFQKKLRKSGKMLFVCVKHMFSAINHHFCKIKKVDQKKYH
jgi:hypothetical protein